MKIMIEIDSGTKIDKYSKIFNEIIQTLDTLGRSSELIEYIGVKRVGDGRGGWQFAIKITFMTPLSKSNKIEEKAELYLDTEQNGWLKKGIVDQTRLFIATQITRTKNDSMNLESYRVADPLI